MIRRAGRKRKPIEMTSREERAANGEQATRYPAIRYFRP
jgi:hypothetical protein